MAIAEIRIPDFGDVQKITVVEVYIVPGMNVEVETPLIALESEKAVMDLPSPLAGRIVSVSVRADELVKSGEVIATIDTNSLEEEDRALTERIEVTIEASEPVVSFGSQLPSHASPSVRALARERQVRLDALIGSGPSGRILREDVLAAAAKQEGKQQPSAVPQSVATLQVAMTVENSGLAHEESIALTRIQKLSGPRLHKSWSEIPHVTHFDQADITELEAFRKQCNKELSPGGSSYSPLVFVIKAVAAALEVHPVLNSSLGEDQQSIILKKFYNIGVAVDTPEGLVVPVVHNVKRMGVREIAENLQRVSGKARANKLAINDLQGATFTISNLGGIGGTGFTPIINQPQVAILGLSKSRMQPSWDGQQFVPRLFLPFSLSYDHRVVDGALAARFCRTLADYLEDIRRILL